MNDNRAIQPVPADGADQGHSSHDMILDFGQIFAIVRRGWWLIGGLGFLGALLAAIIVLQVTPTYQSRAELLLGQTSRVDDAMGALFQDLRLDDAAISGEIAIITSGKILSGVTERLDLANHPEFNPDLRPPEDAPGPIEMLSDGAVDMLRRILGVEVPEEDGDGEIGDDASPIRTAAMTGKTALGEQTDYVDMLRRDLVVRQVGRSNLVSVQYTSPDRMLAAAVPNALVDLYLEDQIDRRFDVFSRVTAGLEDRLDVMRDRLEAAERATIDFRTGNLADGFGSRARLDQQLADLSSRLSTASADYSGLASELSGIDAIIENQGALAASGLFQSPIADTLREEVAELRRRENRLRAQFGDDIPQLADTNAEISRLEGSLSEEVLRLRDDKAKMVDLADARRQALADQLSELEQRAIVQARREVRLTQLEREQNAARLVYASFLDRFNETRGAVDVQEGDAQVIDYAGPPADPVAPNKKLSVALGGVAGSFLGLALAFAAALTDTRLRTREGLQRHTRSADLVMMPRAAGFFLRRHASPQAVAQELQRPQSPLAESLRTLRSTLLLAAPGTGGVVVGFVSTRPGAGKTTTTINMGRLFARMGMSCVIIDADQRRGHIADTLHLPSSPDLVDVAHWTATLESALHHDPESGLHLLTTRLDATDPAGIMLSQRVVDIVEELKAHFDVVLIDTAPLLPVADALSAVRLADQVVMMVPYGSTTEDVVTGRRMLDRAGRSPTCTVMSFAPPSTISSYY